MATELEPQSYYPTAKVKLRIRFEEFGGRQLKDKAPKKTTPKLKGVRDDRAPLKVVPDPESPPGTTRFLLVPATSAAASKQTPGAPTDQQGSSDNLTHDVVGIIPRSATWQQNGIRTADTLSISLRWTDFPIDPRVIRACALKFYLGTVSEQEYAMGVQGLTRGDLGRRGDASREPLNVVPDTYLDPSGRARTNLRFEGWVDKWRMTWGDDEPLVEFECTDNTRLLIKQPRPPRLSVGMEKPIDEAIAEYLSHFPQLNGLVVEYRPNGARSATIPPRLKTVLAGTSFVPQVGPPATGGGGTEPPNIWDYLTEVCGAVAHLVRLEGTTLVVQQLTNILGRGPVPRLDDPYQGRRLESGDYPVRAFVFGRNVQKMVVEREFAAHEPKNIEVRSYDPHRKTVVVARFPEKGDELVAAGPGDGRADKEWSVRYAPNGVRDKVMLKRLAEQYYNTEGRQQLGVTISTKNMASLGAGNLDPDILDMRYGDPFEVLVDRKRAATSGMNKAEEQMTAQEGARQFLLAQGYTDAFATAYAKAYNDAGFQRLYRTRAISVTWSTDDGVGIEVAGTNYVSVRVDKPSEETEAMEAAKQTKFRQPPPGGVPPRGTT